VIVRRQKNGSFRALKNRRGTGAGVCFTIAWDHLASHLENKEGNWCLKAGRLHSHEYVERIEVRPEGIVIFIGARA